MARKKKFEVTHYYKVVVEMEADSVEEALERAGFDDTNYNVTAEYLEQAGGPRVDACDVPNEVKEMK